MPNNHYGLMSSTSGGKRKSSLLRDLFLKDMIDD